MKVRSPFLYPAVGLGKISGLSLFNMSEKDSELPSYVEVVGLEKIRVLPSILALGRREIPSSLPISRGGT